MPKDIVKSAISKPAAKSKDPREIVANTPNSIYSIENKGDKKIIEKMKTPDGGVAQTTYKTTGTVVTTFSNKKSK